MTLSPIALALLGFLLAAIGALLGGGVAWGALKRDTTATRNKVDKLEGKVEELLTQLARLATSVAVLTDRADRTGHTGQHKTIT